MVQGKKEKLHDGNLTNAFTATALVKTLNYPRAMIYILNTNLSGSNTDLTYSVLATPDGDATTKDWNIRVSGQALTAGQEGLHKITDPWDAIKIEAVNTLSGSVAQCRIYVNRK